MQSKDRDPGRYDAAEFAQELLAPTLQNAARLQFYQQLWQGTHKRVKTLADLALLPVVSKREAEQLFENFAYAEAPAILLHTSGTSGRITTRCRSAAEIAALLSVRETALPRVDGGLVPLVLAVDCANHGQPIAQSLGEFGLKAVGFDLDVIDHVIQQLDRTYAFPGYTHRVYAIHASLGFVKMLTIELLRRGRTPDKLGVQLLSTFGEYVSDRWSHWLRRTWQALHVDCYATSETVGGARRCHHCGWFLFDPVSWTEVVDLDTSHVSKSRVGRLAITELYPFSQLQPLVRFVPGDLVEEGLPACKHDHSRAYRFLGRLDRALVTTAERGRQILIFPVEFAEALDELHEIERCDTFHRIPLDLWSQGLGAPLADLALETSETATRIVVTVCPRFSPACFPEAGSRIKASLRQTLLSRSRRLAEVIQKGSYELVVRLEADPGRLQPYTAS